ncbi:MAG: alpha/beta hydrolase, partial [Desulfuromonadales bacterium]|nr:alpha/beta hydrolase [Desulfuromonadales bacterium]
MARLILLPGLGADERMFENLEGVDPAPVIVRHLVPEPGERLDNYATRVAEWLAINADDVVGGSSFGGLVASAVARQRQVRALVLIGSALDASALGRSGTLARFVPGWLLRSLLLSDRLLERVFAPEDTQMRQLAQSMLREAPEQLLLQGMRMMLCYRPTGDVPCPVFAIHGGRDPIMRPPFICGCRVVEDAGHGLVWTHGGVVGEFLDQVLAACSAHSSYSPAKG